jgi:dihydroorotate dehydrogenase
MGQRGVADQRFDFVCRHGANTVWDNRRIMFALPHLPYRLVRPWLFSLDPERAHELTLAAIERLQHSPSRCLWARARVDDPVTVAGLRFPNRIGLAAGLDKNGRCIDGFGAIGFGFVEVGTVTPKAQPGNPKPRIFRLPEHEALINRLGFNNDGLDRFIANVERAKRFRLSGGILGLNIGKNAATPIENAVDDYLIGLTGVYPHADYVTINISSPNTSGLRSLQNDTALAALLEPLLTRRARLAQEQGRRVPMFVKIAPDLSEEQVRVIAATLKSLAIDGVIATNTTLARDAVAGHRHAAEVGGLSGAPLHGAAQRIVRLLRAELGAGFPIIGVGGVMSGDDAKARLAAGADLVQIYSGLIYQGPALVHDCALAMAQMRT